MSTNKRVFHTSRSYSMRMKQALKGIANCAYAWVEEGVSVRDLTLAESIAARNEQARLREPLPVAELPNVVFKAPDMAAHRNSRRLAFEAHKFAEAL